MYEMIVYGDRRKGFKFSLPRAKVEPKMFESSSGGAVEISGALRLVLAASILLLVYFDPIATPQSPRLVFAFLILYLLFSLTLCLPIARSLPFYRSIHRNVHWIDVSWYLIPIIFDGISSNIFYFGLFFAIVTASFKRGFAAGFGVTAVSSVIMLLDRLLWTQGEQSSGSLYIFVRPVLLLGLGYMVAFWGEYEMRAKGYLSLLKEMLTLSNPRFGVDHTLSSVMERLRAFYDAEACLMIYQADGKYYLRRTDRHDPKKSLHAEHINKELESLFLSLNPNCALTYYGKERAWPFGANRTYAIDVLNGESKPEEQKICASLVCALGTPALMSAPLRYHKETLGRIYILSQKPFKKQDVEFLYYVMENVIPTVENIRLVDKLALEAARREREKLARDIHDTIIQPYIGLQLGLAAVSRKVAPTDSNLKCDVEHLLDLTTTGINELRGYVGGLSMCGEEKPNLVLAIQNFIETFTSATGINVTVEMGEILFNHRLAAEAFQMVAEGLSNIRRHTEAHSAFVILDCSEGYLNLRIGDSGSGRQESQQFVPASIKGRASALGGTVKVEPNETGGTVINIKIPL